MSPKAPTTEETVALTTMYQAPSGKRIALLQDCPEYDGEVLFCPTATGDVSHDKFYELIVDGTRGNELYVKDKYHGTTGTIHHVGHGLKYNDGKTDEIYEPIEVPESFYAVALSSMHTPFKLAETSDGKHILLTSDEDGLSAVYRLYIVEPDDCRELPIEPLKSQDGWLVVQSSEGSFYFPGWQVQRDLFGAFPMWEDTKLTACDPKDYDVEVWGDTATIKKK